MEPNAAISDALAALRPVWRRVVPAGDAVGLSGRTLLHAGPPLLDPTAPPAPIRNAAALACLHEGWAPDLDAAQALIAKGGVELRPAAELGVLMPLAAVASPSSTLVEVADEASGTVAWSELHPGGMALQRFGTADTAVLQAMTRREAELAPALAACLDRPVPLLPFGQAGFADGDELHGRTSTATAALTDHFAGAGAPAGLVDLLRATPGFFLTLWMAASRLVAGAAADAGVAAVVTALGGNGERIGLMRSDRPGGWTTVPAEAPFAPPGDTAPPAAGAVGDSGIVDAAGFGGQAIDACPEILEQFGQSVPGDLAARRACHLGMHSAFPGLRLGLDPAAVARTGATPLIVIARLGSEGGLLGRGLLRTPLSLFRPSGETAA